MSHLDEKDLQVSHNENVATNMGYGEKGDEGLVADTLAADYVDPTVVISPEENRRLRRKAFR